MRPTVSILVPVFNRRGFISDCLQSALDQTFTDFEIIVVDNASDDGTREICENFAKIDPRIIVLQNKTNIGPVRNWIRCAALANGVYSKILFSDDVLEPDCLARMVTKLDDPEIAFVQCATYIGDTKSRAGVAYSLKNTDKLSSRKFLDLVLCGKMPVSPGAVLIRTADLREALRVEIPTRIQHKYDSHGAGPDVMIMLRTCERYRFVAHVDKPLVYFRAHSNSFSIADLDGQITQAYRAVFCYYLKSRSLNNLWIRYISQCWVKETIRRRAWVDPTIFLRQLEGSGLSFELIQLCFYSVIQLTFRIVVTVPLRRCRRWLTSIKTYLAFMI